jgi:hypothetical protein
MEKAKMFNIKTGRGLTYVGLMKKVGDSLIMPWLNYRVWENLRKTTLGVGYLGTLSKKANKKADSKNPACPVGSRRDSFGALVAFGKQPAVSSPSRQLHYSKPRNPVKTLANSIKSKNATTDKAWSSVNFIWKKSTPGVGYLG